MPSGIRPTTRETLRHLATLAEMTSADAPVDDVFAALERTSDLVIGHRLFTVLLYDRANARTQRFFSSRPQEYPVGGTKPVVANDWSRTLLEDHVPFIGPDAAAIRKVFPDHALIGSLGCESVLNIPVVLGGQALGTMNLLAEADWYGPDDLDPARIMAALAAPAYREASRILAA